jgi:hypothetical protein
MPPSFKKADTSLGDLPLWPSGGARAIVGVHQQPSAARHESRLRRVDLWVRGEGIGNFYRINCFTEPIGNGSSQYRMYSVADLVSTLKSPHGYLLPS